MSARHSVGSESSKSSAPAPQPDMRAATTSVGRVQRALADKRSRMGVLAALVLGLSASLAPSSAALAQTYGEPGLMMRPGEWSGDIGSYQLPAKLWGVSPMAWPRTGWFELRPGVDGMQVKAVPTDPERLPDFLADIAVRVSAPEITGELAPPPEGEVLYVRVPGVALRTGEVPSYRFNRGSLRPKLDYRYELKLGETPFAMTVNNGLKTEKGTPYGGAHYQIEYDGQTYTYLLGEYGWSSTVRTVADLDGDGKPDFIISVDGNNSSTEFLLLSSQAQPGRNRPTAVLTAAGC